MGFHPFKDKRRPPRPMKFWKAVVTHHIEPDVLRPGEKARHKVVVKNVDLARHEYTVEARTQGTLLAYGTRAHGRPLPSSPTAADRSIRRRSSSSNCRRTPARRTCQR